MILDSASGMGRGERGCSILKVLFAPGDYEPRVVLFRIRS